MTSESKRAFRRDSGILVGVYLLLFTWVVIRTTYQDHTTQSAQIGSLSAQVSLLQSQKSQMVYPASRDSSISELKDKLRESQSQLASKKQMMSETDPAYWNTKKVLEAFSAYRTAVRGQRCYVYITVPPGSQSSVASMVSEFSNMVSGCSTFGSWGGRIDVDADEEAKNGMIPGIVLLHAPRGDVGANRIEEQLSGILPLERSYKLLSSSFPHYADQKPNDLVLWLQFGPNVRWTSEMRQK